MSSIYWYCSCVGNDDWELESLAWCFSLLAPFLNFPSFSDSWSIFGCLLFQFILIQLSLCCLQHLFALRVQHQLYADTQNATNLLRVIVYHSFRLSHSSTTDLLSGWRLVCVCVGRCVLVPDLHRLHSDLWQWACSVKSADVWWFVQTVVYLIVQYR